MSKARIAIAGIAHESCAFSPLLTQLEDFTVLRGQALCDRYPFLERWRDIHPDLDFIPLIRAKALPGGHVAPEAHGQLEHELLEGLRSQGPWDGVYLDLHGACHVEGLDDFEGRLLEAVREIVGSECLIAASYDLHGNVSSRVMKHVDLLTAYRTAPHTDELETCERACRLLVHCLEAGIRPHKAFVPISMMLPGERAMTTSEPAASLYQLLPELMAREGILDASLLVGYCWSDETRVGASALVFGTEATVVEASAVELAQAYWDARHEFAFGMRTGDVDSCIEMALQATAHPVFISDAGDNVTGGGAGDVPFVLERLLSYPVKDAVLASIADAAAVAACYEAGLDATVTLSLGGKLDPVHGQPLSVTGTVLRLPSLAAMNRAAVVQVDEIRVVLTEKRTAFTTQSLFTSVGIDVTDCRLVVVKLGYLFPDLRPVAAQALLAFSPGAINPDLQAVPYRRVRRPMFPLEPNMSWAATLCSEDEKERVWFGT